MAASALKGFDARETDIPGESSPVNQAAGRACRAVPLRLRARSASLPPVQTVAVEVVISHTLLEQVRRTLEGSYSVDREIGRGSAACVYLARDAAGNRVALKVLHPELKVSVAASRFLREIALVSRLDHPHIGRLLDSGERDWLVYYVMPFIEGPTLRQRLDSDPPLTAGATRTLARQMLGALAHAHGFGIVHRDVKPDNIVLGPAGAVLLDFGIARAALLSGLEGLTRSGVAVGTSAYMSPEQIASAEDIDHRTDLYALGCVLFECLAARPPYRHASDTVVLQMHRREPIPDLRHFCPEVPPDLLRVITKALAKDRAARWQSAEEMARELGE
jgi:eukaryotic-like serine/threonine-protein kinase